MMQIREVSFLNTRTVTFIIPAVLTLIFCIFYGSILIPHGLHAAYFEGITWKGTPLQSTRDINLDGHHLQTHRELFLRNMRQFSVRWKGYICIPDNHPRIISVQSTGKTAVYLNGMELLSKLHTERTTEYSAPVALSRGIYPIEIRFTHSEGHPYFGLQWGTSASYQKSIPSILLIPDRVSTVTFYIDLIGRLLIFILAFVWLLKLTLFSLAGIRKGAKKGKFAFILFSLLACIFTYPLVVNFTTHTVGDGWDAPYHIWALWIFNYLLKSGHNPFLTNLLFFPLETNLYFMSPPILKSVLYFPAQFFLSPLVIQNLLYLLSFSLSGTGMFLLTFYFTKDYRAGLLSGFIYAFCPYRFSHSLGHFNLTSTEWIPFFILYVFKFRESRSFRDAALTGMFLLFNALVCFYYMVFCIIFSVFFLIYLLFTGRSIFTDERFIRNCLGAIVIFCIGFSPYLIGMGKEMVARGNYVTFPLEWANRYGADPVAYITPSIFNTFWGHSIKPFHKLLHAGTNYSESVIFIGYIPLLLAFAGMFPGKTGRNHIVFFILCMLGFLVLSFGPYLYTMDDGGYEIGSYSFRIPLPFILLHKIPILNGIRVPSRFGLMVCLFTGLLAGHGFLKLSRFIPRDKLGMNFTGIILFLLVGLEFLAIPYPIDMVQVPSVYQDIGNDRDSVSVLQLPYLKEHAHALTSRQQYYQTVHHKPIMLGYLGRVPLEMLDYHPAVPVLRTLVKMNGDFVPAPELVSRDKQIAPLICGFFRLKYIVLDTRYFSGDQLDVFKTYLHEVFPVKKFYEKDFQFVLEISQLRSLTGPVQIRGDVPERNLYFLKGWKKEPFPPVEETFLTAETYSELILYLAQGIYELDMECRISEGSGRLNLTLNGKDTGSVILDDSWQSVRPDKGFSVYRDGYYRLGMEYVPSITTHQQPELWVRNLLLKAR